MSLNQLFKLGLYNINISTMSEKSCNVTANINMEHSSHSGGKEFSGLKMNITAETPDECLNILLKRALAIQAAIKE